MMVEACRTGNRVRRVQGGGPVVVGCRAEGTNSGLSVDGVNHSCNQKSLNCA